MPDAPRKAVTVALPGGTIDDNLIPSGVARDSELEAAKTFATNRDNHTGTQSADTIVDGTANKAFTSAEKTKLAGVSAGATANSSDADLLDRNNHTGTQSADTIVDGTANKAFTAAEKTKLGAISGTNTGDQTASTVSNTPAGNIAATTVQGALNELDSEKVAIANKATTAQIAAGTADKWVDAYEANNAFLRNSAKGSGSVSYAFTQDNKWASYTDLAYAYLHAAKASLAAAGKAIMQGNIGTYSTSPAYGLGPGVLYFTTLALYSSSATSYTSVTVRTSTGYARLLRPDGTLSARYGDGVPTTLISIPLIAVSHTDRGHVFCALISASSNVGTTAATGSFTEINMTGAGVTSLAGGELTGLTSLNLSNNYLSDLFHYNSGSPATPTFPNLVYFDISGNVFQTLNISTTYFGTSLDFISLRGNPLSHFTLQSYFSPTFLDISQTAITGVTFSLPSSLVELYMDYTRLTSIPATSLPNLIVFRASGGALTTLDGVAMPALETLIVNSTNLKSFNGGIFPLVHQLSLSACPLLESIDVGGMTNLIEVMAPNCPNLHSFDATGSNIDPFDSINLYNCPNLESVRLPGVTLTGVRASSSSYGPAIDVRLCNLSSSALNQIYTDLGAITPGQILPGSSSYPAGQVLVSDNPGTSGDNPSIATAKGYIVIG